jgi:hypothetical protein
MFCKRGFKAETPVFLPTSDPTLRFPHPDNNELFTRLKETAHPATTKTEAVWVLDGYRIAAHPDLVDILREFAGTDRVIHGSAYGRPVVATPRGLVFAYAGGTHSIFIRLASEHHEAARRDNGCFDPTDGKNWIEFRYGGLKGGPPDWQGSIRRWMAISYQESLKRE